eukprot:scaffold7375_cov268-Pinguiococcus_pyrenoidosus.AAC.22
MGHGIAQTVAWEGFEVVGVESSQKSLELGQQRIDESLQKILKTAAKKQPDSLAEKEQRSQETKARISYSTDRGALHDCDVVIEAVVEDMAVKTPLYQELHALCKPETLLCSNTSSLPIQAIAEASGRPQKTIGLHFFNPVQIMRLVEVVKLPETDPADFEMMVQFVRDINKTPVTCVDTPGFIVNRLLVPALAQLGVPYSPHSWVAHPSGDDDARTGPCLQGGHRHGDAAGRWAPDGSFDPGRLRGAGHLQVHS